MHEGEPVITLSEARRSALEYVQSMSSRIQVELTLLEDETRDEGWCWVFFYQSRTFVETGSEQDALLDSGPLIVVKETGALHQAGTSAPLEEYLAALAPARQGASPSGSDARTAARAARSTTPPPVVQLAAVGPTRTVSLDRAEFERVAQSLQLPPPNFLSPLPDLAGPTTSTGGPARDVAEILRGFGDSPMVTTRTALTPLAIPDRVVDVRCAPFDSAPSPCRLYSSRRVEGLFVGLRPALDHDYEVLTPYTPDDLGKWVQLQVQFSAGAPIPAPEEELSAESLAFLFVLVDAYKTGFFRSFAGRRPEPAPVRISLTDLLAAQNDAVGVADRRWLTRAVTEIFSLLVHPGGRTAVVLPLVTEKIAERALRR
jgi:hypothetical protein